MSGSPNEPQKFSKHDIANLRNNINLLRHQLHQGRVDGQFLLNQLDTVNQMLVQIEEEQRAQAAARRFEALYNVSRLLGSSLELQTVLNQVMDAIIQLSGAERGFLMLRDDDGNLQVKAARNLDQQTLSSEKFRYSRTIVNQVFDSGKPIVTTNAAEDPRFAAQASIVGQALRSIMATPLRARGQVIGVAYVDSRATVGLFDDDDLAMLDALSGQAAVAIDNAILFSVTDEQLALRVEQLQQLRRMDLQLNETLDLEKAKAITLEWACRLVNASAGHLGIVEGNPPRVIARHHYGAAQADSPLELDMLYSEVSEVVADGRQRLIEHTESGEVVLITPVLRESKTIGVVLLKRGEGTFDEEQQDLVQRVVGRAAIAIENAQLYERAQAADRAKSEFVGIVAHDLKAPMTSILGYTDLMLMQGDNLTERQREFLHRMQGTVHRMEMLVSDLADISRIESGHFFMDETRVSVQHVVQALRDSTQPEILAREHRWVEEVEADLPDMWVDYYRLLQILTNLVSNAYKYTPNGGTITLTVRRRGDRIQFSVSDTGIGLSKEQIARLGTKFWRAEDEYTRSQPGTGLGFAITRGLVEQMGSQITVESEPGQGSTFTFDVAIAADAK